MFRCSILTPWRGNNSNKFIVSIVEPLISIESSSYSIREPISSTDYTSVKVKVRRQGDSSQPAAARVSTRDRSAMSGVDYVATSLVLPFMPGERQHVV